MEREGEHAAAELREGAALEGTQVAQQLLRVGKRRLVGRIKPAELPEVPDAGRLQGQHDLREVEAADLGQLARGAPCVVRRGPEPQADARRRPPGPAGALVGRCAADLLD